MPSGRSIGSFEGGWTHDASGPLRARYRALHNSLDFLSDRLAVAKINEFLTVSEAAEFLGVSKDPLPRWDRAGKLEACRHPITGYRLYLRDELGVLLKSLRGKPTGSGAAAKQAKR